MGDFQRSSLGITERDRQKSLPSHLMRYLCLNLLDREYSFLLLYPLRQWANFRQDH